MALRMGHANVTYRSQGMRLCCWKTSLEMLMHWRYQTIYGRDAAGNNRIAHTAAAQLADQRNRGYSIPTLADDYLLRRANSLTNATRATWEAAFGVGPVLLTGRYGMARTGIGGHCILAIGLSTTNKVVYLDPFRTGWARGNNYIYMTLGEAYERLFVNEFGLPEAFQAAA